MGRCAGLLGAAVAIEGCTEPTKDRSNVLIPLGNIDDVPTVGGLEFKLERVAVVRDGAGVGVVSLTCTHQDCLIAREGHGFRCPCHGSEFSAAGTVVTGPAEKPLVWFEAALLDNRRVGFFPGRIVAPTWRLKVD